MLLSYFVYIFGVFTDVLLMFLLFSVKNVVNFVRKSRLTVKQNMVGVGGRTIKYAADPDMCGLCLECAQPCKQVCLECAQPCKQVCAGCQVARYCSKECARKCWSDEDLANFIAETTSTMK